MKREKRQLWGSAKFWLFTVCGAMLALLAVPPLVLNLWGANLMSWLLSRELKTEVRVEGWSGGWWGATEISGLTIAQSPTESKVHLVRVGGLTLSPALPLWLLSAQPISLALRNVRVELRRLESGQWNFVPLFESLDTNEKRSPWLPDRPFQFDLKKGSLFLETEEREYAFSTAAKTASLRRAALDWEFQLRGRNGESLRANGQLSNLLQGDLRGSLDIDMSELDVGLAPVLLPALPVMHPDGVVNGSIRVGLAPEGAFAIQTQIELRDFSLPDLGEKSTEVVRTVEIHLALERQGNRWSAENLSVKGSGGGLMLKDKAWFTVGPTAWEGRVAFALDVDDIGPLARALGMIVPDQLSLSGSLAVEAQALGEISLGQNETWERRLAGLNADFRASLDEAQWGQDTIRQLVAEATLNQGTFHVARGTAKVGGGDLSLHGRLSLSEELAGGRLEWNLKDVSLQDMLGETLTEFKVSRAEGSFTHDNGGYHATAMIQLPELALDPKEIHNRHFRLTEARFSCAADMPTGAREAILRDCRLKAAQGDLQLGAGGVSFAPFPELRGDVKGWLAGSFVNALVPEIASRLPKRLRVAGLLGVPLSGKDFWQRMHWQLEILGQGLVWEGLAFEELSLRLNKTAERLIAEDVRLTQGKGTLAGRGSFRVVAPGGGTLQLSANRIPLDYRITFGRSQEAYRFESVASGTLNFSLSEDGFEIAADELIHSLRLRRGSREIGRIRQGQLRGTLSRETSGVWRVKESALVSEELTIRVANTRILARDQGSRFEVDGALRGKGSWVAALLRFAGIDDVDVTGQTDIRITADGSTQDLWNSRAKGTFEAVDLVVRGFPIQSLAGTVGLSGGRLEIKDGLVTYKSGAAKVAGALSLPPGRTGDGDGLRIELKELPLEHQSTLPSFEREGPALLHTDLELSGEITLQTQPNRSLRWVVDLDAKKTNRQLRRGKTVVARAEIPPLNIKGTLNASEFLRKWRAPDLRVRGPGVVLDLIDSELRLDTGPYDVSGIVRMELTSNVAEALSLGFLPKLLDPDGMIRASGATRIRIPHDAALEPRQFAYIGELGMDRLIVDKDSLGSVKTKLRMEHGRLTVEEGLATLLDGNVWLSSPSFVDLQGPGHPFEVHATAKNLALRTYGGQQFSLSKLLLLLSPLFLLEQKNEEAVDISGTLSGDIEFTGTYQNDPGWSKSANGKGYLKIENGMVKGSTLISGFVAKTLLLPADLVQNSLESLFSRNGKLGSELRGLGRQEFVFGTIQSPITIKDGEIFLKKDFKVSSPELDMVINGHSTLEGYVDYDVRTDLIERIRFGKITSLPNRIPVLGEFLRYLNPFTLLEGIELTAKVKGNVFEKDSTGGENVQVTTSLLR